MALRAFPVLYAKDVETVAAFYVRLGFQEHIRMPARPTQQDSSGFGATPPSSL